MSLTHLKPLKKTDLGNLESDPTLSESKARSWTRPCQRNCRHSAAVRCASAPSRSPCPGYEGLVTVPWLKSPWKWRAQWENHRKICGFKKRAKQWGFLWDLWGISPNTQWQFEYPRHGQIHKSSTISTCVCVQTFWLRCDDSWLWCLIINWSKITNPYQS